MWAAEVDGLSQEGKVAKVTKVIELAVADLTELPAGKRSQVALKESGKIRERDARLRALILAEEPTVTRPLAIRWSMCAMSRAAKHALHGSCSARTRRRSKGHEPK